jgi:FkbM family methyltransferase
MYKHHSELLRQQLIQAATLGIENTIHDLLNRPVFLLGPLSNLGNTYGPKIALATKGLIASVDDYSTDTLIHGAPRWTSEEFILKAGKYPNAVAIDFSESQLGRTSIRKVCDLAQIERHDCVVAQAQLGMVSVYEYATVYRSKTIDRLDEFISLADRFDDDLSRATLFANLLFRITYDRSYMLKTWINPMEEYFSPFASPTTFQLGTREHFCDCGAFQGPIVSKFLKSTGYQYESITAFEPDRVNFQILENFSPFKLQSFRLVNKAISSRKQNLRFIETGTISSYIGSEGNSVVQTVKLDDELDKLTFLKMDIEGFEVKALQGASNLISKQRPRIAACVYHYAQDLLDVVAQLDKTADDYHLRLRQHDGSYYYALVLYASPLAGVEAPRGAL